MIQPDLPFEDNLETNKTVKKKRSTKKGTCDSCRQANIKAKARLKARREARTLRDEELTKEAENASRSGFKRYKTAIVTVYNAGGPYDDYYLDYVGKLADGVHANTSFDVDFHCITKEDISSLTNVKRLDPLEEWDGWHIKAEIFREGLWEGYERVLYFDLDTYINGNIDSYFYSDSKFSLLQDFYFPDRITNSIMYFEPVGTQGIFDMFKDLNPTMKLRDDYLLNDWLKENDVSVNKLSGIGSYKADILRRGNASDYRIVCFHGNPRPHEVNWSLDAVKSMTNKSYRRTVTIDPIWKGEDCYLIGGGHSLKGVDLDKYLMNKNVLGINDAYLYESCDILFFGDMIWWHHHQEALKDYKKTIYSRQSVGEKVFTLNQMEVGLSDDPNFISFNSNSGFCALNLALLFGCKRIFLLGFDMCVSENKESNWHENIRKGGNASSQDYKRFLKKQKSVGDAALEKFPEVEIYNVECNGVESKLDVFPKIKFDDMFIEKEE